MRPIAAASLRPIVTGTTAAAAGRAIAKRGDGQAPEPSRDAGSFWRRSAAATQGAIGDHVRVWRAKRQSRILERVQADLGAKGRDPGEIKWNVLFPLFEAGSLEADDDMAGHWAALLANAADPERSEVPPASVVCRRFSSTIAESGRQGL